MKIVALDHSMRLLLFFSCIRSLDVDDSDDSFLEEILIFVLIVVLWDDVPLLKSNMDIKIGKIANMMKTRYMTHGG